MDSRTCGFCFRRAKYDDLPNGSTVYLGVMVCGECLEQGRAEDFKELVKEIEEDGKITKREYSFLG